MRENRGSVAGARALLMALAGTALVVLLVAAPSPRARAQEAPAAPVKAAAQPVAAKIARSEVNVRSGPSVDYYALARLPKDTLVVVLGPEPGAPEWLRVRVPGGLAVFVFGELLRRSESDDLIATVDASRVLMRATSSKAYYPLHEQYLRAGEEVIVLGAEEGEGGTWLRLVAPRRIHGWVHRDLLKTLGPLTDHADAVAEATSLRLDALTDGRYSARARERQAARERAATEVLDAIATRMAAGEFPTDDFRALQQARSKAPTEALRARAHTMVEQVMRAKEERAKSQRDADLRRAREDAEARRRAQEKAEERYEAERKRAQAEERAEPPADGEGVVERVRGVLRLRMSATEWLLLRSRRFRLVDYIGKRVRVRGTNRGGEPVTLLEVDHLEIVPE